MKQTNFENEEKVLKVTLDKFCEKLLSFMNSGIVFLENLKLFWLGAAPQSSWN